MPAAEGDAASSETTVPLCCGATTIRFTVLLTAGGVPGFHTLTVSTPGEATSAGSSVASHSTLLGQFVARATPFTTIVAPGPGCEPASSTPATRIPKGAPAPEKTLAGIRPVTNGALLMLTCAVAWAAGLASLVARTATVFGLGGVAGARNSTGLDVAPFGAWQGLLAGRQINPFARLPFAAPFTSQLTFWSAEPATVVENNCVWPGGNVTLCGETLMEICAVMVTTAAAY